ncbi:MULTISPECIES: DsrH/TusB family sulfur relay protein [Pseudoalteromonas]|uniref:Sulfur relay protein TusB/DsrH n=1 Tax=Pseudoalteromonas luteoviolacea (strain 2ta16) TaxID=1353533 RepID=V4HR76_PSEL2|nr:MULTISPECIES: DsrH/TusB family sulfur metabolism protein [Pseudoalteromonas]ESP93305.1 hypothetical protein PL2TA16_03526 [Pseudoalteromonas luteoviolacea 2ta16]KZN36578.1 hypothetical protein N483_21920 [Pseudoalteromonas luteoviolacea NCIMB 1944]MCG7550335.1 tRNA 2-thiouridine-synthesizing protein [Pseudoalteromonas sp. Of7M-16]
MSSTLHIFSKPKSYYTAFDINLVSEHDKVLLQQDACYDQSQFALNCPVQIYMLETCAIARAVTPIDSIQQVDDLSWVDLIAKCDKSITW